MVSEARVLVVDDEPTVCESCRRILSQEGYRVQTALGGAEGLDHIARESFDLVIADLRMPGTDGVRVLRTVKQRSPATVVIVITGYSSVKSAVEVMRLGAADYLPKPFTPDELSSAAAKSLRRRFGRSSPVIEEEEEKEPATEKLAVLIRPGDFREMLRGLARYVYVPRQTPNGLRYSIAGEHPQQELPWGGTRPVDPLKNFFFGPRARVAVYPSRPTENLSPAQLADLQRAIVGVKRCDLQSLAILDRVFLEGSFTDPFYKAARQSALVVTTDCSLATPSCSCVLMGLSPFCENGFDLNVSEVAEGLIVEAGSPRGEKAFESYRERTKEVSSAQLEEREERRREFRREIEKMNGDFLPQECYEEVVREGFDSPVWQRCAELCVGCAACTRACPTCHCFFLYDRPQETPKVKGKYARIRAWDSCQYPAFARVAGGANPRRSVGDRFQHRYLHKFVDMKDAHGVYGCTGCGRCIDVCMGRIDMREVLWELSGVRA
jgi:sulfhydrogenase subunit beta (sulfur reductase)